MSRESLPSVTTFRSEARRLLKTLRSDATAARGAAERFRRLRSFTEASPEDLVASPDRVRLKHALAVVALENGHGSWLALKASLDKAAGRKMYERGLDVLLNRWFARYEEARASREALGGFLLPYDRQFFVCESEGIRVLGLDPDDPDWERIGHDWVEPQDREAWRRLAAKREEVLRGRPAAGRHGGLPLP